MEINKEFIEQYQKVIWHVIRQANIFDPDESQDVFSDVVIRLMENSNYNEDKGSMSTYLTYVTRSVVGNHFKKKARDPLLNAFSLEDVMTEQFSQHGDPADQETAMDMVRRSQVLSSDQKDLLYLIHEWGYTHAEIGAQQGKLPNTISVAASRAMRLLPNEAQALLDRATIEDEEAPI